MNKIQWSDDEIINAVQMTMGKVYIAAERLGCHADTIYERAKRSPAIKAALESARGRILDLAEASLVRAATAGEPWAIRFILKTQGKVRGYVEGSPRYVEEQLIPEPPAPPRTAKDLMRELLEARDLESEWHGQREREGRRASENVGSARIRIGRAPESRTVLEMEPGPVQRSLADMQAELRSIREAYADAEHREEIAAEAYDE